MHQKHWVKAPVQVAEHKLLNLKLNNRCKLSYLGYVLQHSVIIVEVGNLALFSNICDLCILKSKEKGPRNSFWVHNDIRLSRRWPPMNTLQVGLLMCFNGTLNEGRRRFGFSCIIQTAVRRSDFTLDMARKDSERRAPLHWAVDRDHFDMVDLLLRKDADVNAKNLYNANVRKVIVMELAPIGCTPHYLWHLAVPEQEWVVCQRDKRHQLRHEIHGFGVTTDACCGFGPYKGWVMCISQELACRNASNHL
ncbi:hypothetical protein GIB67_034957 [Kingdonia uniflora]|uniref:Uncharacterized protein n=1 Tax=Kingdonia uniflora TaxID=39325 RepID=A0A7J7NGU5_9MAGN|nr:hypothetical protein GIB67_034957 [Kingdonia uniflora]